MLNYQDKFCGALIGTFVGDALGMPVEGQEPHTIKYYFNEIKEMKEARLGLGTYTDDTEMMIAVAESLIRCRGFNGEDMARAFIENFNLKRGYGRGTIQALSLLRSGIFWEEAGLQVFNGGSFGNGSAMRIAPIGCFYYDNPTKLKDIANKSSMITHAHPLAREGSIIQAFAISLAIKSDPVKTLDIEFFLSELTGLIDFQLNEYPNKIKIIKDFLKSKPSVEEVIQSLGHDVKASNSVPTAIYSFLSYPHDFEKAVLYAIGLGGDTDTIGAMTGAISGAYHGKAGIPARWFSKLENCNKGRDYIVNLAVNLYKLKKSIGNG